MTLPDFDKTRDPDASSKKLWAAVPEPVRKDVEQHVSANFYRFTWRSSFDGDAVVHITRKDQAIALRWKRTFTAAAPSVTLSLNDWEELQRALKAARFWSLDNAEKQLGLDGAEWLIEGRRGDIYHSVHRWSPEGAVHDLGRLFFALAGPPLASVELY